MMIYKNIYKSIFCFSFVLFITTSCNKKQLTPAEYLTYVENNKNGLCTNKEVGDYRFSLLFKPLPYVVLQELKSTEFEKSEYTKTLKEFEGLEYYTFRITCINKSINPLKNNLSTQEEFYFRLQYFMNAMQQDLKLMCDNKTYSCVLFHFERLYHLTPHINFVLAFDIPEQLSENISDRSFVYEDKALDVGTIKLKIKGSSIYKIPELKL